MNRLENVTRRARQVRNRLIHSLTIPRPRPQETITMPPNREIAKTFAMTQVDKIMREYKANLDFFMYTLMHEHNKHYRQIPEPEGTAVTNNDAMTAQTGSRLAISGEVGNEPATGQTGSRLILTGKMDDDNIRVPIDPTRPSEALFREFKDVVNTPELISIFSPDDIGSWALAVLSLSRIDKYKDVILGCIRFGEAQIIGAPEETMRLALEEIISTRYRSHKDWMVMTRQGSKYEIEMKKGCKSQMRRVFRQFENGVEEEREINEMEAVGFAYYEMYHRYKALRVDNSENIPRVNSSDSVAREIQEDDLCCSICLEPFDLAADHIVREVERYFGLGSTELDHCETQTYCGHTFGYSCLARWSEENDTCPLCRQNLVELNGSMQVARENSIESQYNAEIFEATSVHLDENMNYKIELCQMTGQWHLAQMMISCQHHDLCEINKILRAKSKDQALQEQQMASITSSVERHWRQLSFSLSRQLHGATNSAHEFAERDAMKIHLRWLTQAFLRSYLS